LKRDDAVEERERVCVCVSRGRSQLLVKQVTGHPTLSETVGLGGRGKVAVAKKSDFKLENVFKFEPTTLLLTLPAHTSGLRGPRTRAEVGWPSAVHGRARGWPGLPRRLLCVRLWASCFGVCVCVCALPTRKVQDTYPCCIFLSRVRLGEPKTFFLFCVENPSWSTKAKCSAAVSEPRAKNI